MAILLSTPLQLFPVVRIMENGLFTRSGKQKIVFRFSVVALCMAISLAGAKDLDKFVAFVGGFAWWVHHRINALVRTLTF
jgi:solute carrier family 36 (proton-coupled amino acid transporter)